MRNTRKIALALVIVMIIAMTLAIIPASAANMTGGEKLYLVPSANWNQSNARFAAYFFGNGEAWVSMTKVAGESNLYEVTVPAGNWTNVIFCRMNPSASANNWNNKWNQTSDLTYNGTSNCYTVKEGTWDKGGGTWSTYGNACSHTNVGPAATCTTAQVCNNCGDPVVEALGHTYNSSHLCTRCNGQATFTVAGSGAHLGTEWDTGNTANDMTYADGVYTKVYTNVAAGSYLLKVARDHDWGTSYPSADKAYTVATAGSTVTVTLKGTTVTVTVEVPHTCNFVAGEVVPPTFDAEGYTVYSCTCGKSENRDVVPALVAVATADGEKFASLEAALQGGSEIVLLADIKLDAPIVITGSYTLNLNGFTLSYESTVQGEAMITNKGSLTINDSVGTGVINYNYIGAADSSYGKGNYTISNAGNLTVNGGKITIANLRSHAKYPIDNNSTTGDAILVINGGHLYNYNTSAIRMFCNSTTYKNSVTINGGLVEGYSAIWMQNPGKNTVHGALSVTGGEIRTTAAAWVAGTAELKDVGSNVYCTIDGNGGAWAEDSLVSLTGGTFNENVYLLENAPANVTVGEGATFNGNIEYNVPSCAHEWADATCTAPKTCSLCGETEGEALGHTAGAEANCTTAQTCTVCGVELVAKLGHVDANLDVDCDREGCTGKVAPAADTLLSNFTANNLGSKLSTSGSYYVQGVIVEVIDQKNGIFLIDDGTGETFYFRLPKNADGVAHSSWEIKLTLGDKVQVYGKINKYSSSTAPNGQYWPAIQSGVATILEQHAHVAPENAPCTKDRYCACGQLVAEAPGHIDADNNGLCDNCPWDMNLVEVYIAIGTDPKYNGVVTNGDDGKALYWTWTAENFDAIVHKGTSTVTVYTTAKDYMQLKKQNTLTIVNKEDVTVKYVVISVTNATYLTHLKTALTNSGYEFTADEVNFTATIQLNSTEDFVLENKASSTIYVNGVTIVYAKKGAHVHEFKETITTPATCTEAGLKTFACECGEGTYTETIEALGHDYVEGVCSRCEAVDPDYVPACAHKDTGLDAKCDLCGEYFLPESPFKLEMYQASKKATYYFTGSMSGYYYATSTDITKAVDLYAEEVDGGYNVYFMNGSTKNYLYIELSGTHINAKFGSTKGVWYVDPTYGSLTTEVGGTKYFLGTYSSYVTFGGTAYSRLTSSTADVSQYIGRAVSLENHVCENTTSSVTNPTCTAQGYTTYKCADCGISTKGDYVAALGHSYENCVCTVCQAALSAVGANDSFDFSSQENFDAVVAGGKLAFVGSFRDNSGSFQFNTNSNIQFVAPANSTVTITGHSAQYGVFNIYLNGEKAEIEAANGVYKFTVTEATKVVIATGDNGASYSYIKGIALEEYVDRTISADTTITFGSEGNYKDSIVDFSGIQIGDNGGNNSQVKNGSFDLLLKAGSKVVIHGYPGYTSYQLNGGEAIESEYYTYIALTDMVLTVTPVSGNNYFYSIEITLHEGVELVEAKDATCTEAGNNAHYVCTCHEESLTEKVVVDTLDHSYENGSCVNCGAADPDYVPHEHNFVNGKCECGEEDPNYVPHVNTLVVGDTNKIVVDGDTFNDYGLPIEWVAFVADEKAHYEFVGNNGALVFIFDAELNLLCGGTGKADLEAGAYLICIGNGVVGEINVAVTKSEIVPPHEHNFVDGKCECGESDPNYAPPHEHNFVDGKCECGESDPNYVPPHEHNFVEGKCECGEEDPNYVPETPVEPEEPQKELNFFEQIIKAITDFFAKIGDFFKNLFAKK